MRNYTMILVLMAALVGGCSTGDFTPRPDQDEAVDVVWRQVYGALGDPPAIGWRSPECGRSVKWFDGYVEEHTGFVDEGECKGGFFQPTTRFINLTAKDHLFRTALAHELYHAFLNDRTGDPDADHTTGGWAMRTNDCQDCAGIMETARQRLIDLRL